ncbi:pyridoxamine 5'-phosphate oxidase family protein [Anianabacter salinae]|uniref:pyridoxamine 5'-phosphate oxidase family protein n=1 Tax=Anianabacter salinae TaxID=2851023 RepID=UPI00225E42CC|nr:pyridoxamine 5'-phosphate oxidase family protein [Anianabacter salinae]MBV0912388.1 pyridoxamine 5'-phosphate oxidase family protein [Anianabacter salinae]
MSEWFETLDGLHARLWQRLARGAADAKAPERHLVMATAGLDGGAEARTVVLRRVSESDALIEVHTDALSRKVAELAADPLAAFHVWNPRQRLQIRLRAQAEVITGTAVAETWARVPDASRGAYGTVPAPGQPIPQGDAFIRQPQMERFAILRAHVQDIDVVHLGEAQHRRARFQREGGWQGEWLAP